jgi:hypothetical protein
MQERLAGLGYDLVASTPEEFATRIKAEIEMWAKVIRGANIKAEWPETLAEPSAMKLPRRKFLHPAAGAASLPAASRVAWAQAYPTRPVKI